MRVVAGRGVTGGLAIWCAVLLTAPVAGDIGSCNQALEELDPALFFAEKQRVDCEQCVSCELSTQACVAACEGQTLPVDFEPGCYPLARDGEVCLGALRAASCDEYGRYMDDEAAETPTECNFCPLDERPGGP